MNLKSYAMGKHTIPQKVNTRKEILLNSIFQSFN